jgi:hypothetical protein
MTGFRWAGEFRYSCVDRGCYHNSLPDWSWMRGLFPRNIRPTDVDGMVEVNGYFLFIEQKGAHAHFTEGQRLAFRRLAYSPAITVLIIRPGKLAEYEHLVFDYRRVVTRTIEQAGFTDITRDDLAMKLCLWAEFAEADAWKASVNA